jgi:hypothetical protein
MFARRRYCMTFDHDLCILFFFHKCDELTQFHLASLRKHNPDSFILPLTDDVPQLLPGAIDVARFPSSFATAQKWRSVDTTFYRWFENRSFNARRYLSLEYDCLCTVNLRDYYSEVFDADVAGVDFFTREQNPRWKWFMSGEMDKLPAEDRKYAAGICPLTCTFYSHEALEEISRRIHRQDLFSELRLGTIVNKLGLAFRPLPPLKRSTVCWHTYPWQANRPGLFHGIKSLRHNDGRPRQPGMLASRLYAWLRSLNHDRQLLPFYLEGKRHGLRKRLGLTPAPHG